MVAKVQKCRLLSIQLTPILVAAECSAFVSRTIRQYLPPIPNKSVRVDVLSCWLRSSLANQLIVDSCENHAGEWSFIYTGYYYIIDFG